MSNVKIVIAGNFHQYNMWLHKYRLSPIEYRYIDSEDRLYGFDRNSICYKVGSYYVNPVWNGTLILSRNFDFREEDDVCQK